MTVPQAKNREFEDVIVLWPIAVPKDQEWQRRQLYNAITRAKSRVLVIVQDPNPKDDSRLGAPPFEYPS